MIRRSFVSLGVFSTFAVLVAVSAPAGATLYAVDYQTNLTYRIDPQTAVATLIGPAGQELGPAGLAVEWRTGRIFVSEVVPPGAIDGAGLGVLDPATGAVQPVPGGSDYVVSLSIPGIAFAADGTLLGASAINPGLYRLDPVTSIATFIADWSGAKIVFGFASTPDGTLFAVDKTTLYRANGATGVLTPVGPHGMAPAGIAPITPLAFEPETGQLLSADGLTGRLFRLNPATGAAALIGNTGIHPSGLASRGVTEIPALDARGVTILATALALLAVLGLHRQRLG